MEGVEVSYCTQCGFQNAAEASFCARCGTRLATAPVVEQPPPDSSPATSYRAGSSVVDSSATLTFGAPGRAAPLNQSLAAEDAAAVAALPPENALLVVLRGPQTGSRFLLDTDIVTAGRHDTSDISLDDVTVSRRHAEFRRDAGHWVVADMGSLNGTYLNRGRVDMGHLTNGDEVQIGKFRLVFFAGPAAD